MYSGSPSRFSLARPSNTRANHGESRRRDLKRLLTTATEHPVAALLEPLAPRCHRSSVPLAPSTFFGGSGDDVFRDAVVAPDGSVYLAGASLSTAATGLSLPPGGYDVSPNGGGDALIVRLSADLSTVLAATYLGGSGWEKNTYGLALDAAGDVYVAGETRSSDFPTTSGAYQRSFGGGVADGFVAKLSGDLSTLRYATYLGGSG